MLRALAAELHFKTGSLAVRWVATKETRCLAKESAAFGPFDSINHEATMKRITLLGIVFMTGFLAAPALAGSLGAVGVMSATPDGTTGITQSS